MRRWLLVIVVMAFLCPLVGCTSGAPISADSMELFNAQRIANMRNYGLVVQNEDGVFLTYGLGEDGYLFLLNGKPFLDGAERCYLGVGDWFYYSDKDSGGLNRISVTSGETQRISELYCDEVIEYNGFLYCTPLSEHGLIKMELDGTAQTELSDGYVSSLFPYHDELYYCEEGRVYKMDLSSYEVERIEIDDSVDELFVVDGSIYYTTLWSEVKKYTLDSGETIDIAQVNRFLSINFYTDSIVISSDFPTVSHGTKTAVPQTCLVNLETMSKKKINNNFYTGIFSTTNGIYGWDGLHAVELIYS